MPDRVAPATIRLRCPPPMTPTWRSPSPWPPAPDELLTASYERAMKVDRKSKRDVVTNVDYASEALVIKAISERFPADAILAEESGREHGATRDCAGRVDGSAPGSSTRWTGPSTTPTGSRSSASRSGWSRRACRWWASSSTRSAATAMPPPRAVLPR